MTKAISLFLSLILLTALFLPSACAETSAHPVSVVTTIFPIYDWVREIAKDTDGVLDVTLLLDNGVDLHNFQPTVDDMIRIAECDVFICIGGESDDWVDDALAESLNPNLQVLRLLDLLGDDAREEELVEGMQDEEEDTDDEAIEEVEYDEHIWLSLRNAQTLCRFISDSLCSAVPDYADTFAQNTRSYLDELSALNDAYAEAIAQTSNKTLLFGDRFPFRYMTDDYGLNYYAAFAGCSAETEASFQTIAFLSGKLSELNLPAVLTIEGSDRRIAETIIRSAGLNDVEILEMNSLQSVTAPDAESGITYLSVMRNNLDVLKTALG